MYITLEGNRSGENGTGVYETYDTLNGDCSSFDVFYRFDVIDQLFQRRVLLLIKIDIPP